MRIALLVVSCLCLAACGDEESGASKLAELQYRPVLGRLSVDTGYEPCEENDRRPRLCSADGPGLFLVRCSPPLRTGSRAFKYLSDWHEKNDELARNESHATGLHSLLWQSTDRLEATVQKLEIGAVISSAASVQSDLAAARIEHGLRRDSAEDFLAAITAAEKAVDRSPGYAPALFNRALAIELLGLTSPAVAAWRRYLEVDPESLWADEAERRLRTLEAPSVASRWSIEGRPLLERFLLGSASDVEAVNSVVAEFPQEVRELLQRSALPAWAVEIAPRAVESQLARSWLLAQALERATGDSLLRRDIDQLRSLLGTPMESEARRGYQLLDQGYRALYGEWRLETARDALEAASLLFGKIGSLQALWSRFLLGLTEYYAQDDAQALVRLDSLAPLAAVESPILEARIDWVRGLIGSRSGQYQLASDMYSSALDRFCDAGERPNQVVMHSYLSHAASVMGDFPEAWNRRHRALTGLVEVTSPVRRFAILETILMNLRSEGSERGALLVANQLVRAAELDGGSHLKHSALMRRASIFNALGDSKSAGNDLAAASIEKAATGDPTLGARVQADEDLLAAELLAVSDPSRAIELANRSLKLYRAKMVTPLEQRALAARGRAKHSLGEYEAALEDYLDELRVLRRQQASLDTGLSRASYQRQMGAAYSRVVRLLALDLNRPKEAREFADQARAWAASGAEDALGETSTDTLASNTVLVEFAVLDDVLCVWAQRDELLVQECKPGVVGAIVADTYRLITRLGEGPIPAERGGAAYRLYEILIAPAAELLDGADRLVIVPDDVVALVPFAALSRDARPLIEDYELIFASSTFAFHRANHRHPEVGLREAVLSVWSSPRVGQFGLSSLPMSELEAQEVATIYGGGVVADGQHLSREALLERLASASVFHFAGHVARADREGALELVLGSGQPEAGFGPEDLKHGLLPNLDVVFLSGCRATGVGPESLPGPLSLLARSFLSAGARSVVGSSWDVSDRVAREMARGFHTARAAGAHPAKALRLAQLDLHIRDSEGTWAFYRLYAG